MKIFKKLLTVLIAVVMAFGVLAISACEDKTPDSQGDNEQTNNNNEDNSGKEKPSKDEVISGVINSLSLQQIHTLTINESGESCSDIDGNNLSLSINVDGKIDIDSGNGDLITHTEVIEGYDMEVEDNSRYIRNWDLWVEPFKINFPSETDYSQNDSEVEYIFMLNLNEQYSQKASVYLAQIGSMIGLDLSEFSNLPSLINFLFSEFNYNILSIANITDAITVNTDSNTIIVDINKSIYNMTMDIGKAINAIDNDTTVSDFLGNENIRKYFSVITSQIPVGIISSLIGKYLDDVTPSADTYDYLLNVLDSEALKTLINSYLAENKSTFLFTETLGNTTLSDLQIMSSIKSLYDVIASDITETEFVISFESIFSKFIPVNAIDFSSLDIASYINVRNATIAYLYADDYSLTGMLLESERNLLLQEFPTNIIESISIEFNGELPVFEEIDFPEKTDN